MPRKPGTGDLIIKLNYGIIFLILLSLCGCHLKDNQKFSSSSYSIDITEVDYYINYYGAIVHLNQDYELLKKVIGNPITTMTPQNDIGIYFYKYMVLTTNTITNKIEAIKIHHYKSYKVFKKGLRFDKPAITYSQIDVILIDKTSTIKLRLGDNIDKLRSYLGSPAEDIIAGMYRYRTERMNQLRFDMFEDKIRTINLTLPEDERTRINER